MVIRVAAALTALFSALAVAYSEPLDDVWLTVASGEAILRGADPRFALQFTHTPMVDGAINPQWGAQIVLAVADSVGLLLPLLVVLVGSGLWLTLDRSLRRASPTASVLAMLAALVVLGPHLVPRAQSFSIFLFALALLLLERASQRRWLPLGYGALMIAWANLHGAFVLGQALPFLFLLGHLAERLRRREPFVAGVRSHAVLVATGLVAAVAPLANPVGWELYHYAYLQISNPAVRALATEWKPALPNEPATVVFWLFAVGLLLSWRWRGAKSSFGEVFVLVATFVLGLSAIRSIPWLPLAGAPTLAVGIDRLLATRGPVGASLGRIESGRSARTWAAALLLAGVLGQILRPALPPPLAHVTTTMPVRLVDRLEVALDDTTPRQPIFNSQSWGGYIAYRLGTRVASYVDGRIETPTWDVWQRYLRIIEGGRSAPGLLEDDEVRWAVVERRHDELHRALTGAGWQEVAADERGWLLRRAGG